MLGLGLGFGKLSSYKYTVKKLIDDYIKRVTAAGGYLEGNECATAKVRELNSQRLLDDASWLLIPEGIEEDIVFAQKPTSGLGDLTFTRASDATRTNSAGVIERTPWNLLTWSEMFSDVAWTKTNATITANTTTAPNGTLTADKIVATAIAGNHIVSSSIASFTQNQAYTFSYYAKSAEYTKCGIRIGGAGYATQPLAAINLANGAIISQQGFTSFTVTSVGDGWYRISGTFTSATGLIPNIQPLSDSYTINLNNFEYTGNGTSGISCWGAQLVEGTDAKPYFATTNRQDVPRLDYRNADGTLNSCPRLLLEPQRTNSIRNSTMVGAVAGSPGTFPTNWTSFNIPNLTNSVVGLGVENGLNYIDLRVTGNCTISSAHRFAFEQNTGIAATNGQTWTSSGYFKLISQIGAAPTFGLRITERTSAGASLISGSTPINLTSSILRYSFTRTLSGGATTAFAIPELEINVQGSTTYDFTIRIAAPQMELGATASTFIPTTTAAVTRLADAASKTGISSLIGQTEGTIYTEVYIGQLQGAVARTFIDIGSTSNRIFLGFTTASSNTIRLQIDTALASAMVDFRAVVSSAGTIKVAAAYKDGDCALYVNGVAGTIVSNGSISFTTLANLVLGQTISGTALLNDSIAQAALFKTRLTNAQLVDLTGGRIYYNPVEAYYAYYLTPEIPSAVITSVNSFF
jgi:hypothetical protein